MLPKRLVPVILSSFGIPSVTLSELCWVVCVWHQTFGWWKLDESVDVSDGWCKARSFSLSNICVFQGCLKVSFVAGEPLFLTIRSFRRTWVVAPLSCCPTVGFFPIEEKSRTGFQSHQYIQCFRQINSAMTELSERISLTLFEKSCLLVRYRHLPFLPYSWKWKMGPPNGSYLSNITLIFHKKNMIMWERVEITITWKKTPTIQWLYIFTDSPNRSRCS